MTLESGFTLKLVGILMKYPCATFSAVFYYLRLLYFAPCNELNRTGFKVTIALEHNNVFFRLFVGFLVCVIGGDEHKDTA